MNKYKKIFGLMAVTMSLSFISMGNAYCFEDNKMVDFGKKWTINFNKEVSTDDLNKEAIVVKESNGTVVKCKLTQGGDKKSIVVNPPEEGYKPGESYKLIIGNKTHSINNKNIKKEVVMNFNITKQEIHKVKLADFLQSNTDNILEYGQYIYYINKNDNNSLYRMKKDNSENIRFFNFDRCNNLTLVGNDIYFTTKYYLYKMANGGPETTKILDIKDYDKISIYKNSIYYIGKDKNLHIANLNGKEDKAISTDLIRDFWIKEGHIYYKNQDTSQNVLWKMNLDGSKKEEFLNGIRDYKRHLDYNYMKFLNGYVYLPTLENAYSTENAPIHEKYCYRIKLSNKEKLEKIDMEDKFIDYEKDEKTWHNYFYDKLYCVENDRVKEFGANIPKTRILDVDKDYIYFMDYSEYICRVKKDGSNRERILKPQEDIYGDSTNHTKPYANVESKDYIYYVRNGYKSQENKYFSVNNLCKIKKDGSENIILKKGVGTFISEIASGDKIYGLEWKSPYFNIVEISEQVSNKSSRVLTDDCSSAIHLSNGWIYYISDNTLKRIKTDGSKKETVEVFKESGLDQSRSRISLFYGDYFYSIEPTNAVQFKLWRKDLKNDGKYQYFMPMIGQNLVGVDDNFVYLIDGVAKSGGNEFHLYRSNLKTQKNELLYITRDIDNFKEIGVKSGKFYFTRTIHGIKKGY